MRSTDALGRRSRTKRQPTGKRISLRPRDLLWLEKLHHHGPLPTSYLYAFSRRLCGDEARTLKRLSDLFHEGAYLKRPYQQFETIDARFNQLVYDLDEHGEALLQHEGLWSEYAPRPYGPWKHRCMTACITASLELGARTIEHLRYIPQHQILERAGVGMRVPITYENPQTSKTETRDLIPDALCGIEYQKQGQRSYRFFVIEADRSTEPHRSHRFDRKSYRRTIMQYREFVGGKRYQNHFNLKAGMLVLTVTTNARHMHNMIDLVTEIAPSGQNSFMLFQTAREFGRFFKPPQPLISLITGPWARAGHGSLHLDRL